MRDDGAGNWMLTLRGIPLLIYVTGKYWTVGASGGTYALGQSTGEQAAANAAQRWLVKQARAILTMAGETQVKK
jgi:alpha/beta superfamily hydrolase